MPVDLLPHLVKVDWRETSPVMSTLAWPRVREMNMQPSLERALRHKDILKV
jgi:hypothetical protein